MPAQQVDHHSKIQAKASASDIMKSLYKFRNQFTVSSYLACFFRSARPKNDFERKDANQITADSDKDRGNR